MRNLLLTLAFRGTAYHGFQVQANARTVCEVFQDAVQRVISRRCDVKGASRTDAGVHANGFALGMKIEEEIPCDALVRALNVHLPPDIAVLSCREVPADFHPRYMALGKRYLYKIWNAREKNPFLADLAYHVPKRIDAALANRAAGLFVGERDFSALCAAGGSVQDKVRHIHRCGVVREGDLLVLSVTGDGFLYNMVRILTGTVLEVCAGRYAPEEIPEILDSCDRTRAGTTAPAHGLYLDRVFYDREEWEAEVNGLG